MKKIFSIILAGAAMFSLSSCITSLQPLVSYDKIITDSRITGSWMQEGEAITIEPLHTSKFAKDLKEWVGKTGEGLFAFTGDKEKDSIFFTRAYAVSFEKHNVQYNMVAALMKIGGEFYMDIYPGVMHDGKQKEDHTDAYNFSYDYTGGFTVAKLELNGNSAMKLKFINGNFIKEQVGAGKMRLKHESNALFDTFIITASTQELQQFIEKYGNDERIYSKETTISLAKK
jgi:hypothetical protein